MKRFVKFLAVVLSVVSMLSMTAFANETCSMAESSEEPCEIWWVYDKEYHWRACVNHKNASGNDTVITAPEEHEFVDGICTVCERPEAKGFIAESGYWIVFLVVAGVGFMIVMRYKPKKLGRDEMTTFGLDKFKKFR